MERVAVIIIAPSNRVLGEEIAPSIKMAKMMPQTGSRLANRLAVCVVMSRMLVIV
jgi:hypothetical protein